MSDPNPVLDFMLTRRSSMRTKLTAPAPNEAELTTLLTAASRVPDHGRLEPWRFIVVESGARQRLADLVQELGNAQDRPAERTERAARMWLEAPMLIAVVMSPKEHETIPQLEQDLTAGAVCLSLVNAARASGWGAVWLTGWAAFDRHFLEHGLKLAAHERIAGFIHIGSCDTDMPDRPRPDLASMITRLDA